MSKSPKSPRPVRRPFLLCLGVALTLASGALAAGRPVAVVPSAPVAPDELVTLRFEGGGTLPLKRNRRGVLVGLVPDSHARRAFRLVREPGGVPEVSAKGGPVDPRSLSASGGTAWLFPYAWQDRKPHPTFTYRAGLHQDFFLPGREDGFPRMVRVHLPPAYLRQPDRAFPFVYALDGQNLFDAATSFSGAEWNLDEALEAVGQEGGDPPVVIGIDNGYKRRMGEYTFTSDPEYGGGEAEAHLRYILDEVEPFLTQRFRLDTGKRMVMGSSLGGLFSAWAALTHPDTFHAAAAISPSLWWSGEALRQLEPAPGRRASLWVDMGTQEGEKSVEQLQAFRQRLEALGWSEGRDLTTQVIEAGTHREISWSTRAADILRWLGHQARGDR